MASISGDVVMMGSNNLQPGSAAKGRILLVEDDAACSDAYSRTLRNAGYTVLVAADFRRALEVLEADEPLDLLLSDIVMPGSVNGIALSRMARMRRRDLKVLYITGYHIPGVDQQAFGPILRKPLEDDRLLREIEQVLNPV